MLARLLPLLMLAASWVLLRSLDAAATIGWQFERILGRVIVVTFALGIAYEAARVAWPRLQELLCSRAAWTAFVAAGASYALFHALITGMVRRSAGHAHGGGVFETGQAFGPLTVWPYAAASSPTLGIVAHATPGRLLMVAALSFVFACAVLLAWRRFTCKRAAGAATTTSGAFVATACPACGLPLVALLGGLGGALAPPVARALGDPTSPLFALLEVAGPLVALVALVKLAAPPEASAPAVRLPARVTVAAAALPLVAWPAIHAQLAFAGFPRGASTTQQALYDFFLATTAGAILLFTPVVLLLGYYAWRYRVRDAFPKKSPIMRRSTRHLIIGAYTIIPAIVLFALGFVSFGLVVEMEEPPEGTLHVEVEAQRFSWKFTYPDGTVTWDELYVPEGELVVLRLTSHDVMHSFFVPDLGIKMDVLPGHNNTIWFRTVQAGTFQGYCAEFCGPGHAHMLATVTVFPEGYRPPYGVE